MYLGPCAVPLAAQNLVPNPSFEDTTACETPTQCTLLKATDWHNPNTATPDVWDCDLNRSCGADMEPNGPNGPAYQYARTGTRLAGVYAWYGAGSSNTREYVMCRLTTPLVGGQRYVVALWVARKRTFSLAVDHLGVWFGLDSLYEAHPNWLHVTPQVELRDPNSSYLVEDDLWTEIRDTLLAAGGERWMVVGHFAVADSVNGLVVDPNDPDTWAYYYLDDLRVEAVSGENAVSGPTEQQPEIVVVPLGDGVDVRWSKGLQVVQVDLFDAGGRLVRHAVPDARGPEGHAHLRAVPNGFYVLRCTGPSGQVVTRFVK